MEITTLEVINVKGDLRVNLSTTLKKVRCSGNYINMVKFMTHMCFPSDCSACTHTHTHSHQRKYQNRIKLDSSECADECQENPL